MRPNDAQGGILPETRALRAGEFLEAEACVELRSDIAASQFEKGTVLGDDEQGAREGYWRSRAMWGAPRKALLPELENHFRVSLSDFEGPEFPVHEQRRSTHHTWVLALILLRNRAACP